MRTKPFRLPRIFIPVAIVTIATTCSLLAGEPKPGSSDLVATYAKVSDALASDDLGTAKTEATAVRDKADAMGEHAMAQDAATIAAASDLPAARAAFKTLSASVEPLAADQAGFTVMTCSMVHADWVQVSGEVKNPYLGKEMQSCGSPKKSNDDSHHGGCGGGEHSGCDM